MAQTRNFLKKHLQAKATKKAATQESGSRFEILSEEDADILNLTYELPAQKSINNKLEAQMLLMQQMLENLALRDQHNRDARVNSPSPIIPPDQSFLNGAAQVIQDSTQVEKSSPFLDSVATDAWNAFDVKFDIYRGKCGKKFLRDCIKQEVLTYYQAQIPNNCRTMLCNDLRIALKNINRPFLDPMAILRTSLSMDATTTYNSEKTKNYLSSFLNLLERNPIIENSLSGASIVKMFFTKLQPKELSDSIETR